MLGVVLTLSVPPLLPLLPISRSPVAPPRPTSALILLDAVLISQTSLGSGRRTSRCVKNGGWRSRNHVREENDEDESDFGCVVGGDGVGM